MLLLLDSRFSTYQSDGSFQFTLPSVVSIKNYISLKHAQIPNVHFNIMTGVNDTIDFVYNSISYSSTIPAGCYNSNSILNVIQSAMNTTVGSSVFTVVYNTSNYTLSISASANFSLRFKSGVNSKKSAYATLGFKQVDTQTNTIQTSTQIPDFTSPSYCLISIDEIESNIIGSYPYNNGYEFIIPFTADKGSIQNYSENIMFEQKIYVRETKIKVIKVSLTVLMNNSTMMNMKMDDKSFFILLLEYQ